jgi:hypothetical protein
MCLNNQFDATSLNRIVQEVLLKTVDDETLRQTLHLEFRKQLMAKGREISIKDFSRKLSIISEMTDHSLADTEGKILVGQFERIFMNVANRARICVAAYYMQPNDTIPDLLNILTHMQAVEWPMNPGPIVESVRRDFKQMYFQAWAQVLTSCDPTKPQQIKPYLDSLLIWDRACEFETHVNDARIRQFIASFRRQLTG